jgi:hypothetical protein
MSDKVDEKSFSYLFFFSIDYSIVIEGNENANQLKELIENESFTDVVNSAIESSTNTAMLGVAVVGTSPATIESTTMSEEVVFDVQMKTTNPSAIQSEIDDMDEFSKKLKEEFMKFQEPAMQQVQIIDISEVSEQVIFESKNNVYFNYPLIREHILIT